MSKLKNMAVFSAMLVGVMIYTSPAKSAVCFLPDDDGNCGGGDIEISDGTEPTPAPEEKCDGFTVSATEYEKMKNCFSFFSCTKSKTKEVVYKQKFRKENTTWSNGVCCTGGTTYDSAEGKCCPAGGCTHECDAPKEWSSTLHSCECPKNREENTNHECCPVGEHADGAICCPEKKHNEGGVCKCDSQYNTDKNGNCVLPVEKNCSDINKDYKNKDQVYQCNIGSAPVFGVSGSDGQCYQCIKMIDQCLPRDYKIYYVVYPDYLQGDTAIHSGCSCFAYLVKGISSNTDPLNPGGPIKTNAISTPGGNSTSTKKIQLPAILTDVSSSNPYSVKIQENSCYGSEHCSAQAVKFDVFEAYAPETAKRLKEDDDFTITGGITFSEAGYYYTGRQLKPKSQSINTCDDYVVILGNGNPKACAQISSDYYNYHESCPKGLEKKRLPNVYDSTGAQCYECVKQSGDGSDPTCKPGTATIEYAYYYYYLHSDSNKPHSSPTVIPYGSITSKPTITYTNKATKTKITVDPFTQKTTLNIIHDSAGKRYDYTCSEFFGDSVSTGGGLIKPDIPTLDIENGKDYITGGGNSTSSTKWTCGYMLMTKANYTKATGRIVGGPLYTENAAGNNMYYGDNTFENVDLLKGIGCAGEYLLVFGCKKEETCTCPSGYSLDKTSVSSCGTTEASGWTFDSKTVCGKTCGKCTAKTCTPTCTSETGCKYGSKTKSDGCGGTCTVCYPPCAIGYWYGSLAQENCYIKPATYIKQPSNPNCSKCVCDNGKPDANGHYLQCQYF